MQATGAPSPTGLCTKNPAQKSQPSAPKVHSSGFHEKGVLRQKSPRCKMLPRSRGGYSTPPIIYGPGAALLTLHSARAATVSRRLKHQ